VENGYHSTLKVTLPPLTIPSWPCLFSGLTPEQLGYYTFIHPEKGLFNSVEWQKESIFSLEDLRVFALNVPGTFPAWKINGEMITGMMSPSLSCYPAELKFFLNENWIINGKTIPDIFKAFKMKEKLFLKKLKEEFDLLVYVIRIPDSLSHHAHVNKTLFLKYIEMGYRYIDNFIGKILNENQVENLMIISDHGLKFYNYRFFIKRWLEKKRVIYINMNKSKKETVIFLFEKIYRFIKSYFNKIPFKKYFKKILGVKEKTHKNERFPAPKLDNSTRVQPYIANIGGLFLSSLDRSKKDFIQKTFERDKYINRIISPSISGFPDFFIILRNNYIFNAKPSLFLKLKQKNIISHSESGFFLVYGNRIKKGTQYQSDYINIAPTLLKLLNRKKPDYMNGEPLDIFH